MYRLVGSGYILVPKESYVKVQRLRWVHISSIVQGFDDRHLSFCCTVQKRARQRGLLRHLLPVTVAVVVTPTFVGFGKRGRRGMFTVTFSPIHPHRCR